MNRLRRFRRWRSGRCTECGYDLRATPAQCPECGTDAPHVVRPVNLRPYLLVALLGLAVWFWAMVLIFDKSIFEGSHESKSKPIGGVVFPEEK
jgi:hypothetical protein